MSLTDEFRAHTEEQLNKFDKTLLDKYGPEACEAASKLDSTALDSGTLRSYKPQIRQIISEIGHKNPEPQEVVDVIAESDKKANTKNVMVLAMKKYYQVIGEEEKGEEAHQLAKDARVAEIDFNREMEVEEWITKDEFERIQKHILPDEDEKVNIMQGPDSEWHITIEHKALVNTLFFTGCRVGEVCKRDSEDEALSVDDLYPESQQIRMYRLKKQGEGYKRDMKVVPEQLFSTLNEYLEYRGISEGHIFPFVTRTAQNRINDIHNAYTYAFGKFKHMEKLTPHKFRHGRVTDLANHAGLEEAGQYVEHSSPEITNAYRHLAAEQQRDILPEEQPEDSADIDIDQLLEELDADSIDEAIEKIEKLAD